MSPSQLRAKIVVERMAWVKKMLANVRALPLDTYATFQSDPRNVAAAESYLRRALEALLDLGRHVLAKGFGQAVTEYKEVAMALVQTGVLNQQNGNLLRELAGYRNRMVHFYHEISDQELYEICTVRLNDVNVLLAAIIDWIKAHPELIDQTF
jgi:uncharacterized protein YutE (UPF0331/DUF86 family)